MEFTATTKIKWAELLTTAINQPGILNAAYRAFHNYSLGNRILATMQCQLRGIELGPIATFEQWKKKERFVKKGEKAIWLYMPLQVKIKPLATPDAEQPSEEEKALGYRTIFALKSNWFVLSQTDGKDMEQLPTPGFDYDTALNALNITQIAFDMPNGNCQGFATKREGKLSIALNPLAVLKHKTYFHEVAHCLLHFGEKDAEIVDADVLDTSTKEVEAESVALLCVETLGLPGAECARGYIQHWLAQGKDNAITEQSAKRIMSAAEKILKAGMIAEAAERKTA